MNISKTYKALIRIGGMEALKDFILKDSKSRKYNPNDYYHSCLVSVIARHERLASTADSYKAVEERLEKLGLTNINCNEICHKVAVRQININDYLILPIHNRVAHRKSIFRLKAKQLIKEKYPRSRVKKFYSISPSKLKMKVLGLRDMPIAKIINGKVVIEI